MFFDPVYFLFLAPGILLALWAQARISRAYNEASRIPASSGYSGARAAAALLREAGVTGVEVETVPGVMTDHYSPTAEVLRLTPEVFAGRTLAGGGAAAAEAGHARRDNAGD